MGGLRRTPANHDALVNLARENLNTARSILRLLEDVTDQGSPELWVAVQANDLDKVRVIVKGSELNLTPIKDLRLMASLFLIPYYSHMTKRELVEAITDRQEKCKNDKNKIKTKTS